MKVECPHCGFKGKLVDNKCMVCGLFIEEKPPFIRQLLDKILQKKRIVIAFRNYNICNIFNYDSAQKSKPNIFF